MAAIFASILTFFGFGHVDKAHASLHDVAKFKGACFHDKGKLKPAQDDRWVCILPNGNIRASD